MCCKRRYLQRLQDLSTFQVVYFLVSFCATAKEYLCALHSSWSLAFKYSHLYSFTKHTHSVRIYNAVLTYTGNTYLLSVHMQSIHINTKYIQSLHIQRPFILSLHIQRPFILSLHIQSIHIQSIHIQSIHIQSIHIQSIHILILSLILKISEFVFPLFREGFFFRLSPIILMKAEQDVHTIWNKFFCVMREKKKKLVAAIFCRWCFCFHQLTLNAAKSQLWAENKIF